MSLKNSDGLGILATLGIMVLFVGIFYIASWGYAKLLIGMTRKFRQKTDKEASAGTIAERLTLVSLILMFVVFAADELFINNYVSGFYEGYISVELVLAGLAIGFVLSALFFLGSLINKSINNLQ